MSIFGLIDINEICNTLVQFKVDEFKNVEHFVSEELFEIDENDKDKRLFKCIIVSDSCLLTVRPKAVFIHDMSNLQSFHCIKWYDVLPV